MPVVICVRTDVPVPAEPVVGAALPDAVDVEPDRHTYPTGDASADAASDQQDGARIDEMPLGDLETEIATLAGHLAAATCRFLTLLAAFDLREGWAGAGMRSCAHWLSWRCGMSLTTAHEQLRVAHAMRGLPVTTSTFAAGRLSYAKVRAITRVAAPDTEAELVAIAENAPAAHLDRLVSGLRRAQSLSDETQTADRAEHHHHWDEDGTLVVRVRLSAQDGATYLAALSATRDALDERHSSAEESLGQRHSSAEESSARNGQPDAVQEVGLADDTGLVGGEKPAEGAESVDPVEPVTMVQAFVAMAETALENHPGVGPSGRRPEVVVHVDVDVLTTPETTGAIPAHPAGDRLRTCRVQDGPGITARVARELACDGGIVLAVRGAPPRGERGLGGQAFGGQAFGGAVLDIGRRSRRPNAAIMRALWIRDQGCVHPGCGRRRRLHAHHILHWAHGGLTALHNLVLLCGFHHRAVHREEISIELRAGCAPRVMCGGAPVALAPPTAGRPEAIRNAHDAEVTAHTTTPTDWLGDPLRRGYAVTAVLDSWSARATQPVMAGAEGGG